MCRTLSKSPTGRGIGAGRRLFSAYGRVAAPWITVAKSYSLLMLLVDTTPVAVGLTDCMVDLARYL
jgi:hypothetical protein